MNPITLFCPYQKAWIDDPADLKLAEKSRRVGFSYGDAYASVEDAVADRCDTFYSSADLSAAREYVGYCKEFAEVYNAVGMSEWEGEELVPVTDESGKVIDEQKIYTIKLVFDNGRRILCGSSNPNFFRSKGGNAKMDELAFHKDQHALFKAAHATSQFWGYQLSGWSSHHGEGSYFNAMLKQARAGQLKASVHRVTIYDAMEQGIVERIRMRKARLADVPAVDLKARQEWLDNLRSTCPDQGIWEEEYECRPSSDHGSLLPYELIAACEEANLATTDHVGGVPADGTCYAGFDVGRKKDLSVLWVDQRVGDVYWCRSLVRMKGEKFSVQEQVLDRLMAKPSVKRLCIDSTGIGLDLSERLQDRWGRWRVEAVNFSAGVKSEIAMPFVRRFQDRLCRIPADPALREALHSVRKLVTATGNVRLDAAHTEDGHADEFWAGALASAASDQGQAPLPAPLLRKPVGW